MRPQRRRTPGIARSADDFSTSSEYPPHMTSRPREARSNELEFSALRGRKIVYTAQKEGKIDERQMDDFWTWKSKMIASDGVMTPKKTINITR